MIVLGGQPVMALGVTGCGGIVFLAGTVRPQPGRCLIVRSCWTGDDQPVSLPRNRYFDVLRATAIVRVVVYHTLGYAWLTIVFPAMGVMFALAGSLMAGSLDRGGTAVRSRLRRLLPALWVLGAVAVPLMLWQGWTESDERPLRWGELLYWVFPIADPPGSDWGGNFAGVLWYLRAYLWFVLLSPAALLVFRRWPVATVLAPLSLVVAEATGVLEIGGQGGNVLLDIGTYGTCWLLGFAHHDGLLRRIRPAVVFALAGLAGALGAGWFLTHPGENGYDLTTIPLGNALWSVGFVLVLLRFEPSTAWLERVPGLARLVTVLNARAVTVYLWHEPAIMAAGLAAGGLLAGVPLLAAVVGLTAVAVLLLGWVEDVAARRRPTLFPGGRGRHRRDGQLEHGAAAGVGTDRERAAVQVRGPLADREPESDRAGPAAEPLEQRGGDRGVDTRAVVGDGNPSGG
jgi:peptidoglycan/LPS O-acetylase OafA/YrhL